MPSTPVSLLDRLRFSDQPADWERFVLLYSPLLYLWACKLHLQPHDAADLVQDVFLLLQRKLKKFQYDERRRFRGWLWTVLVNKHRERLRQKLAAMNGEKELASDPKVPDPGPAVLDKEERQWLIRRALEVMQRDFQETTWRAYWEYAVLDRPAGDVARELSIAVNAVYVAKSRVLRRLREEFEGLFEE